MTDREKNQIHRDIADAFSFARFVIDNPGFMHKIKDNAEINILPCRAAGQARKLRCFPKNTQVFISQAMFRPL